MSTAAIPLRPPSLRRNFSWTLVGYVIYAASQWVVLILIAKLGSPEMLGQYALAVAIVTPATMLFSLNLRSVLVTDIKGTYCFEDYLSVRLVTCVLAMATLVGIALMGHYGRHLLIVILTLAVGQLSEWVSDICYGLHQKSEEMDRIARSLSFRAFLSVTLLGLAIWWTRDIVWGVVGLTLGRLIIMIAQDIRVPIHWNALLSRSRWHSRRSVALAALPLGIVLMLNSLNSNIPRYFIESHAGVRSLGIFSAIASVVTIGSTVINALGQSATPRLAKLFASGHHSEFTKLIAKLLALTGALGVAGVALAALGGPMLLRTLFRPEYAQASGLLVQMTMAGALLYLAMVLAYANTAARYFGVQMPLLAAGTVSAFLSSWYLVPSRGLEGGVMSISISAIVVLVGEFIVLYCIVSNLQERARRVQV